MSDATFTDFEASFETKRVGITSSKISALTFCALECLRERGADQLDVTLCNVFAIDSQNQECQLGVVELQWIVDNRDEAETNTLHVDFPGYP